MSCRTQGARAFILTLGRRATLRSLEKRLVYSPSSSPIHLVDASSDRRNRGFLAAFPCPFAYSFPSKDARWMRRSSLPPSPTVIFQRPIMMSFVLTFETRVRSFQRVDFLGLVSTAQSIRHATGTVEGSSPRIGALFSEIKGGQRFVFVESPFQLVRPRSVFLPVAHSVQSAHKYKADPVFSGSTNRLFTYALGPICPFSYPTPLVRRSRRSFTSRVCSRMEAPLAAAFGYGDSA